MPIKVSRILLIIEAILIAGPITLLAIVYSIFTLILLFNKPILLDEIAVAILVVLCVMALFCGWFLYRAFIQEGTQILKRQPLIYWIFIIIGVFILAGVVILMLLAQPGRFSIEDSVFSWFIEIIFSLPILFPLLHISAERFLRKTRIESESSK